MYAAAFHVIKVQAEHERRSWVTGLYWTVVVMSTLRFGDITFTSDIGRLFSIVVLLSGVVFHLVMLPFLFIRLFYAPWLEARVRLRVPREVRAGTRGHLIAPLTSWFHVELPRMTRSWPLVAYLLLAGNAAEAHHSVLGFDGTRPVTLRGVVADVVWSNPHTYISVDVTDGADRGRWVLESESPVVLQRLGWTRTSVQPGDRVVSVGGPGRKGERIIRCQSVTTAKGVQLPCYPPNTQ